MKNIGEKIAYIKGLAEGLKVDDSTNEGKIIAGMLDVLDDLYAYVSEIDEDLGDTQDIVASLDEDLSYLEEDFYGEDGEDDSDDYDDDNMFELVCQKCGEEVYIDGETLEEEEIFCPNCKEKIEFDIGHSCGCGCEGCE